MRINLITLVMVISMVQIRANVYSQKVTLNVTNATMAKVLKSIERQTGYVFFYGDTEVPQSLISIQVKDADINLTLDKCFKNLPLSYKILGKNIVLKKVPDDRKPGGDKIQAGTAVIKISGKITDGAGNALPGVSVTVKGSQKGTTTNLEGLYSIETEPNAILVFSMISFKTIERSVSGQTLINIIMAEDNKALDEVIVVGYGTQRRQTVTGSIADVKGEELSVAPVASTSTSLAGRLPGLIAQQSSGQPGADAANLQIRGFGSPLIIVDGIEADLNSIDPNMIESVSILKDASASIYGSRAGNGVILVTTKRGKSEKPTFTLNSSATLQGITRMVKPSSAGQFAELQSEAWLQSGKPADQVPFTPEQIEKYYQGTDPLYPNTNWYDVLIRDFAPQQQHNIAVRGGNERIRYYSFLGYLNQESMWKKNGGDYSRYNFQSNIDAQIQDNFSVQLDISSTMEARRSPYREQSAGGGAWQDYWNTYPIYPAYLPDPSKISYAFGAGTGGAHVVTNSDISGYNNGDQHNIRGLLALNYEFKFVEGLKAKAFVNYSTTYGNSKYFVKPVKFYTYDPGSDIYTLAGALGEKASLSITKSQDRMITGQFSVNYARKLESGHDFSALALYEVIDYYNDYLTGSRNNYLTPAIDQLFAGSNNGMYNNGAASEMGRKSIVGRLNYNYKNTYLLESSLRADASAKFPKSGRWGYFPSVSLGWRLSNESFLISLKNLDDLKWRVSYGKSGNDNVLNFQYLSGYSYSQTYVLGSGAQQGIQSTGLANPNLTWEELTIYNTGFDFSFFNKKIYGAIDAFYRERKGIPANRLTSLPSTFGANLPPENLNSQNSRGFELELGSSGKTGEFGWDVAGNVSWARSKWKHFEEPEYTDETQSAIFKVSNRWVDRQTGYISDGLFTSQSQIDELPFVQDNQQNTTLRPGDIRYKDLNGDGKIDWQDQKDIGKGTIPQWMLGLRSTLRFKNFDTYLLLQGALGYYNNVKLNNNSQLLPSLVYDLRWTPENNDPNALVPRSGGAATNSLFSDYYLKKAGYMRLKVFSLGYNLSSAGLNRAGLSNLRIFLAGTNLLTFDRLKVYGIDPESPSGNSTNYYPQQRTFSLGLTASL